MKKLSQGVAQGDAAVDRPPPPRHFPPPGLPLSILAYPVQMDRDPLSPGLCSRLACTQEHGLPGKHSEGRRAEGEKRGGREERGRGKTPGPLLTAPPGLSSGFEEKQRDREQEREAASLLLRGAALTARRPGARESQRGAVKASRSCL